MAALTREACDAIEREARFLLENSISEFVFARQHEMPDYREENRKELLATAEVLGTLKWSTNSWDDDEEATREIEFSPEAVAWMAKTRRETATHVEYLDTAGEGREESHHAEQAYLLHVLDRVLGSGAATAMAGAS